VDVEGLARTEGDPPPRDRIEELVFEITAGSESALDALFHETSHRVYGFVVKVVGDPGLAEEVTLEVYTQIWRGVVRFDAGKGTALGWLLMLARSRAIDARRADARRNRRDQPLESVSQVIDRSAGPEESAMDGDRMRRVQFALSLLTPDQRAAIEAAFFGGLSHTEVAASLGTPLGTVKTRIRTGLAMLKRALEAKEGAA
jgi:RNA polymerase sigma-70 factor (ECF subfamily)